MSTTPDPLHPADERILSYLSEHPPDYVPIVANRLGMHLRYVERRVDILVDRGLLRPVTGEVIYTATEKGERWLADGAKRAFIESSD
jgi:DNA-binding Lrp family transcriptional regulator